MKLKRLFWLGILMTLCGTGCVTEKCGKPQPERVFFQGSNVTCRNGNVMLSKVVKTLLDDDFTKDSGLWEPFTNFEDKLIFKYDEKLGTKGLVLTKDKTKQGNDTAFELTSKPIDVYEGSTFTLTICARATVPMRTASGHNVLYINSIKWLDKDGKVSGEFPYRFDSAKNTVAKTVVEGIIPPGAVKAIIRIGADSPNITETDYLTFTKVSFVSIDKASKLCPTGNFTSRPFQTPKNGTISWCADTPGKSSVTIQIATAPDVNGVPGKWAPFAGPDSASAFNKSGAKLPVFPPENTWCRYNAILHADGDATPVLKCVRIGDVTDCNWRGIDSEAPVIKKITPSLTEDANAPVVFTLSDGTGIDWSTFKCTIDGKDVTASLKREGGTVTYTPAKPFAPPVADVNVITSWNTTNYMKKLDFMPINGEDNALRVTREDMDIDTAFSIVSPKIIVKENGNYNFSIDVRHDLSLVTQGNGTRGTIPGKLSWYDAKGVMLGKAIELYFENKRNWQTFNMKLKAPAGARHAQISIGFDTPNIFDKHFFDLRNPKFEGDFDIQSESGPNLHDIVIKAADLSGNSTSATFAHLVASQSTSNIVSMRHDGAVLIDDKPFFPIGLYAVWKKDFNKNNFDVAFSDMKKGGFNLAHTYSSTRNSEFSEFMDAAHRNGIKLYIASGAGANSMDIGKYLKDVARERLHPAVLAWYLADDTANHVAFDDLRELHNAIHEIDPAHVTAQADPVGTPNNSRYRHYVHSTDVFLPEIYPIRELKQDDGVSFVIRDMKIIKADLAANGNPVKSIWPIIQYFDGWTAWKRFPTYDELRAMSFLAIIHGGNGITWYTYGGYGKNHGVTETPETWSNICKVATDLKALENVFLELPCPQPDAPKILSGPAKDLLGFDSISFLLKKSGGKQYLICANSVKDKVVAQFNVKGASHVNVMFENREVKVNGGLFTDEFAPYAVHVYEMK